MNLMHLGALACAAAASIGQVQRPDPPTSVAPPPHPMEPDPRTVRPLTPEQKRQREEDANDRLGGHGLTVSLLGITTIPPDDDALGKIGGLSGLAHLTDARFLAVSDNSKTSAVYELGVTLSETDNPDRFVVGVTMAPAPMTINHAAVDGEGIAMLPDDAGIVITYERPPTVALYRDRGKAEWTPERLGVPSVLVDAIRHNRAFESVVVRTPASGREIWVATEAAPETDGPEATVHEGTRSHVVVFTGRNPEFERELVYVTDPSPAGPLNVSFNSLAEFCGLPDGRFLALERGFSPLKGFHADLFVLDGSTRAPETDGGLPELIKAPVASVRDLGVHVPTNLEGMALGPRIAELTGDDDQKGRLLLMVADDNFGSDGQQGSQVVALRIVGLDPEDATE